MNSTIAPSFRSAAPRELRRELHDCPQHERSDEARAEHQLAC